MLRALLFVHLPQTDERAGRHDLLSFQGVSVALPVHWLRRPRVRGYQALAHRVLRCGRAEKCADLQTRGRRVHIYTADGFVLSTVSEVLTRVVSLLQLISNVLYLIVPKIPL